MALYRTTRDIKNNKLFTGVKEKILTSFFDQKALRTAREGEIIYKTGDASRSIYLVINGEVKVKFPSHSYISTKIHNDFFGEKELVEETKRISSAMAFTNVSYYIIDKSVLNRLTKNNSLIENNLKNFGEYKLPETSVNAQRKVNIAERDKPVSFRVYSNGNKLEAEDTVETEPPPVSTQQILPDLDSIDESFEDEGFDNPEENIELEKALEELESISEKETDEEFEQLDEVDVESSSDEESISPVEPEDTVDEVTETPVHEEKEIELPKPEKPIIDTNEKGIDREIVRRIFWALNVVYSSISLIELVKNTNRAVKDLTNSGSADLVFIDENLATMYKVVTRDGKTENEYFQISDGLTGVCAVQKRTINYDRPTEDSHFNSRVDYPGTSKMTRILYFPIISDSGETIAVLQTARDNTKFTENEIWYLAMISKQLETAITRTINLEQLINKEKLSSGKKLSGIISQEIEIPVQIIESYIKILHSKNLPAEADDLVRMIQKQVTSILELTDSILKVLVDDVVLSNDKIHFNEFIDDVLELISEYCESKDVKLFKKIGDGAVIEMDRSKLYTAILQFIKASVLDSRNGDRIYFSSELSGETISISIQNEGKGIISLPDGEILDYFYYREKIKEDEVNLLLAKKIINSHLGHVDVESIKGVGSTFRITLPITHLET
jgi:signal transduction histidine kinase